MVDAGRVVGTDIGGVELVCSKDCAVWDVRDCPRRPESCAAWRRTTEDQSWAALTAALQDWADNHLDQFERIRLSTEFGHVYVSIDRSVLYPDSFDQIVERS